jgi:protein NEDD1
MVDLNISLTTVGFSPEGASIYLGTEDGKLLIQDLRALDKSPKSIIVSELGYPIDTLAVQVCLHAFKLLDI